MSESAGQFQYVKLPDGSYGKFAADATDEQIRGQVQKDFPTAFAPPDNRNSVQKSFDANTATNPNEPLLQTGLKSVASGIGQPFVHPLQTGKALLESLGHMSPYDPQNPVALMGSGVTNDYQGAGGGAHGAAYAGVKLAGNLLGQTALGDAGGAAAGAGSRVLATAGDAAERAGYGTLNNAMGVTPKMMRYGQNPARGVVDQGLVPALSKASLETKIQGALPTVGKAVGDAVGRYLAPVPSSAIAGAIETPISEAGDVMSGFGGGRSTNPLADFWASTERTAPGAQKPIYGPGTPSLTSPVDLWRSIRNLDKNTRFSPDPEIEGVNEVRRDVRGGLRNLLEDHAPGVAPSSQLYGDLRVADDALSRSTTPHGVPKSLSEALAFPATTAVAPALVKGGRLASGVAPAVPTNPFVYTAPVVAGSQKKKY